MRLCSSRLNRAPAVSDWGVSINVDGRLSEKGLVWDLGILAADEKNAVRPDAPDGDHVLYTGAVRGISPGPAGEDY